MQNQINRILSTDLHIELIQSLSTNEHELLRLENILSEKNNQVLQLHTLINQQLNTTIEQNVKLKQFCRSISFQFNAMKLSIDEIRFLVQESKNKIKDEVKSGISSVVTRLQKFYQSKYSNNSKILKTSQVSIQTDPETSHSSVQLLDRVEQLEKSVLILKQQKHNLEKELRKYQGAFLNSPQHENSSNKSIDEIQKQNIVLNHFATYFQNLSEKKYCGQTINNKKHGQGVCEYTDAFVYEGTFIKGQRHGLGQMRFEGEVLFRGWWKDGRPSGKGTLFYVGQGDGNEQFSDIEKYCGHFNNGAIQGYGTVFYRNGQKARGYFEQGKLTRSALIQNSESRIIEYSQVYENHSVQLLPNQLEISIQN